MRVLTVLGTRPEIIRLSRTIERLDGACEHLLVHTGQNFEPSLSDVFFDELGLRAPDRHLGIAGEGFGARVGAIVAASERLLRELRPDRLLVLGDTDSALCAYAAKRLGVPVLHMEAGNRCFDDRVPEEVNRRIIDQCSDVLLPYTAGSRDNLLREGFGDERIVVTGNPIKEVLDVHGERIGASTALEDLGLVPGRYLLLTAHRQETLESDARLTSLLDGVLDSARSLGVQVIFSVHPRTAARIDALGLDLDDELVRLCPPFGLFDFIALERAARCVMTDSGTVQEECCIAHVPAVTVRDATERPETIACGSNRLSGVEAEAIVAAVEAAVAAPTDWTVPPRVPRSTRGRRADRRIRAPAGDGRGLSGGQARESQPPAAQRTRHAPRRAARGLIAAARGLPLVSIVIPTFNREAWLRGAIQSVLAQDYPRLELIVVDDGSTDRTPDLLAELARGNLRRRLRHLRQPNAGQAAALNRGNERARGSVIGYLSDDDLLAPGAVARLTAELVADPSAVAAYPAYRVIDSDGRVEDTVEPIEYSPTEAIRLHDTIVGPGALVRRDALEAAGGWDSDLSWMGDLLLWMRIGTHGRVARVAEPLASWRRHEGARTVSLGGDHAREHLEVAERGLGLLGDVTRALRAEAIRNACVFAALFGGKAASWPQHDFAAIDLHRPRISAWSCGLAPTELVGRAGEEAARAWHELAAATLEVAALRGGDRTTLAAAPSGLDAAMARLGRVGLGHGAAPRAAVGEAELRTTLLEAALDCGAENEPGSGRFLIVDWRSGALPDQDFHEMLGLALRSPAAAIDAVTRRRREELAGLRAGRRLSAAQPPAAAPAPAGGPAPAWSRRP